MSDSERGERTPSIRHYMPGCLVRRKECHPIFSPRRLMATTAVFSPAREHQPSPPPPPTHLLLPPDGYSSYPLIPQIGHRVLHTRFPPPRTHPTDHLPVQAAVQIVADPTHYSPGGYSTSTSCAGSSVDKDVGKLAV
jgi:hypothetical protein